MDVHAMEPIGAHVGNNPVMQFCVDFLCAIPFALCCR